MLTTLKEILPAAREGRYAVPGFDYTEDVMVRAILETAERLRSPVIMMCLDLELESGGGNGWVYMAGAVRAVAEHHDIPIVLHYDHGSSLDNAKKAIDLGFTSVMIDGSMLPFEENVAQTAKVVELASPHGVSVEAELGFVGGFDLEQSEHKGNVLTEPGEAAEFVKQTKVDALAVSIGTAHGTYQSEPTLNIERLKELREAVSITLVLHGGSGTPDDQIRESIENGICKLNIFADERQAMYRGLKRSAGIHDRPDPLPEEMFRPIKEELSSVIEEKIRLCGSNGRV